MSFDPNARATEDAGIFGLPYSAAESNLIIIPVPWEATTSYGSGTSKGPEAILEASKQVDLFDFETGKSYELGYHMLKIDKSLKTLNAQAKKLAVQARTLEDKGAPAKKIATLKKQVNTISDKVNSWVYKKAQEYISKGKLVALVGGDHSSPYGIIHAVSEKYHGNFGVLHIDAHHDLRQAYEGFTHSHASIMYNVMEAPFAPKKLVQVGIRDFSEQEKDYAKQKGISVFYDTEIQNRKLSGETWASIVRDIIAQLPQNVYISFDIDGLSPFFCPNTGTPVPGGLDYSEALFLFKALKESKKTIIGFDLNEVAPGKDTEWDANVGARLLYKMAGWTMLTN